MLLGTHDTNLRALGRRERVLRWVTGSGASSMLDASRAPEPVRFHGARWGFKSVGGYLARFGLMTTELAGITFSFEAGFAQQTPGFSHSPRYTYGLCVCTRTKREFFFLALWSHTSHVHGPRPRRNWARVSATKVCHRGILLWYFLMRGLLRVPNLMGLGTTAQCEVPLKRKRLSATLVGLSV